MYGLNAVLGQFVSRKSVAISFYHMKMVLDLSPRGPFAWVGGEKVKIVCLLGSEPRMPMTEP